MRPLKLPPRLKAGLINAGLVAGSLLVAFIAAEIVLRLYMYGGITWKYSHLPPLVHEPDPVSGWRLAPNQEASRATPEFQLLLTTNADGLPGPEREPDPDAFTIVLLGDSYMEASHVPHEESFASALEATLGTGYRVINLGVGGFGTVQAWRHFAARGAAYDPDLVLLAFYAENDIYNNSGELSRRMWGENDPRFFSATYAALDDSGSVVVLPPQYERAREAFEEAYAKYNPTLMWLDALTESAVEKVYKQAVSCFRQNIHEPGDDTAIHLGAYMEQPAADGGDDYARAWDEARQITDAVLLELRDDASAAGADFAVFAVPSKLQSESEYQDAVREAHPEFKLDLGLPHRRLEALCRDSGVPYRDLLPDFREAIDAGESLNYAEDSHWNAAGHAFAAAQVAAWLHTAGLLERGESDS